MYLPLVGIVLIAALVVFAYKEAKKHGTRTHEELQGICMAPLDTTLRRQSNLAKTLELFSNRSELTNTQVRDALGVSSRTAVRYLDELERQGRVEQIGTTGHSVSYRLQ